MSEVFVRGSIAGAGDIIVLTMDSAGAVAVTTTNALLPHVTYVPVRGFLNRPGTVIDLVVARDGSYSLAIDSPGPAGPCRVVGIANSYYDAIWLTDDGGVLTFRPGTAGGHNWRSAKFKAALARAAAGGAPARILIHGHSHVAGEGAGTGTLGLNNCAPLGCAGLLPALLTTRGIPTERHSFFGDYNAPVGAVQAPYLDSRIVYGTGWAGDTAISILGGRFMIQPTGNAGFLDFTPGFTFIAARVWTPRTAGLGISVGIYIDGVLNQSLNQAGANALITTDITGLSATKISVRNNGTGQGYVSGIECFRSSQRCLVTAAGCMNAKTSDLLIPGSPWQSKPGAIAYAADLHVVYIMTNDINNNTALATWLANLTTIIADLASTADVIIVIDPPGSGVHFTDGVYDSYIAAVQGLAPTYGAAIVDCRQLFGTVFNSPLMYDANHPNAAGHDIIAQRLAALIYAASL